MFSCYFFYVSGTDQARALGCTSPLSLYNIPEQKHWAAQCRNMRTAHGPSTNGQERFPQIMNQVILYATWLLEDLMESWASDH